MSFDTMYGVLAHYYDALMAHVDYEAWTSYALRRLGLPQQAPKEGVTLLDLGCGTGTIAINLARRGYDVIGIDGSADMLAVAHQKAEESGLNITWSQQPLMDFEVGQEVDGVLCLCDTLNYLTGDGDLEKALAGIVQALKPGGSCLFDVHTAHRLKQMAEAIYADELEDVAYIWQNEYDERERLCTMYLTLFVAVDDDLYRRYEEVHVERAYLHDEIMQAVTKAGLTLESTHGELRDEPPASDEARVFYVASRPAYGSAGLL